ncbi:flagellar filament capping protein FliD [Actinoplanes sp. N902-109]|uniref:flagellar filament capping protein FliD n=1 Tax=Actinoplanes sp. (strain N902-109) TaxID=649831 RepID=UPI0003293CDB|nr:flagellar filament capping protein FliD [Actinoplanes sp. N902-109]AGL21200.1 flagellar hook-associated 2 domain-containing protein [Actinoplanes sp. N902-109]
MTSSVDGLVSGLSTSSMITSLLQVEAAPQTRLKTKVSAAQTVVSSYQSVNAKLVALKNAAADVGALSTWRGVKPTTNSSSVTATAVGGTNTATGSMTFDVVSLAKGQSTTARIATSGDVTSADSFTVSVGSGDPVTIALTDKSAQGIANALNGAGIGVKASVVTTGGDQNILQFVSTKTGTANGFTVSGLDGVTTATSAATDAKLQVGGSDEEGGFSVTSGTNTFTGLMAGVTVTVAKVEPGVTMNVESDVAGMASKFQALVDAANAALTEVTNQTAYDPSTKVGSPLTGDFMVRQMSQTILSTVSTGLSYKQDDGTKVNFGSLSKFGIELDRSGKLTFDAEKFTASYNADPAGIKTAGIALGDSFRAVANTQIQNVTSAITGRKNAIDAMNVQIDNWDVRLAAKKTALQKQYTDLETALGKLKDQGNWLSGQIASLG